MSWAAWPLTPCERVENDNYWDAARKELRAISAETGISQQELIAEELNYVLTRYPEAQRGEATPARPQNPPPECAQRVHECCW